MTVRSALALVGVISLCASGCSLQYTDSKASGDSSSSAGTGSSNSATGTTGSATSSGSSSSTGGASSSGGSSGGGCSDPADCSNPACTGHACDDRSACSYGDRCLADGGCQGIVFSCAERDCQTSACDGDGGCTFEAKPDGSDCQSDSNSCTNDLCDAGACVHATVTDGIDCGNGQSCSGGSCGAPCSIAGNTYSPGQANPDDSCQSCQPGTSISAWTNLASGATCTGPAPSECQASPTCDGDGGCQLLNLPLGTSCSDDGNSCTADACDGSGVCTHVVSAIGAQCGDGGMICDDSGVCRPGCLIDRNFVFPGPNPANACQACNPTVSIADWTSTAGNTCNDGNICTSNDACAGGQCIGTPNTNSCDDGNPCTTNDVCRSGNCKGTKVAAGTSCGGCFQCTSNGACDGGCPVSGQCGFSCSTGPSPCCG